MFLIKRLAAIVALCALNSSVGLAATCPASPYMLSNNTNADAGQVMANFTNLLNCINAQPGLVFAPMGRLTLTSGVPVLTTAVSGAGTVYYTPYQGNLIPIWSGAGFVGTTFGELSNVLANSSIGNAGPGAATAGAVYDLFVWSNAGAIALTRGPAWASTTARSLGLNRVSGILTNSTAIANGPGAGYGTYVGTVMTDDATGTVSFIPAVAQPSGGAATIGLWNNFNRRQVVGTSSNSNNTWTVQAQAPREAQGGPFRVRFVSGLPEDTVSATYKGVVNTASATFSNGYVGVGLDQTTAFDQSTIFMNAAAAGLWYSPAASSQYQPLVGKHYVAALEASDGTNSQTFYGGIANSRLTVSWWY